MAPTGTVNTMDELDEHDEHNESDEFDRPDVPVHFASFRSDIRLSGTLLMLLLPMAIALEIALLFFTLKRHPLPTISATSIPGSYHLGCVIANGIVALLLFISALIVVISLQRPLRLEHGSHKVAHIQLHRIMCSWTFYSFLSGVILQAAPDLVFTAQSHRAPPTSLEWLKHARLLVLLVGLVISGTMRRGPELYYKPREIAGSYGLKSKSPDEVQTDMSTEMETNVFDWANTSYLGLIFLFYNYSLAKKSILEPHLGMDDLPHLAQEVRQAGFRRSANRGITLKGQGPKPKEQWTQWSLLLFCWSGREWTILSSLLLDALRTLCEYLQVLSTREIIRTFEVGEVDKHYAELMCWGLFLSRSLQSILQAFLWVRENYLLHLPTRMTLAATLFEKILNATDTLAHEKHTSEDQKEKDGKGRAQVMNLLQQDNSTVASLATIFPKVTNSVISLLIGVLFLYSMLGVSAFIGLACLPISIPITAWLTKLSYNCQKELSCQRDARISALRELIANYKLIKLNAFESYFQTRIGTIRRTELGWQRYRALINTWFQLVASQVPVLAILVTFSFYTKVFGHPLQPSTAFVALGLFNRVRSACSQLPSCVTSLLNTKVALERLTKYLNQPELPVPGWDISEWDIIYRDATVCWPKDVEDTESFSDFALTDLNLTLPVGKLTLVRGPVAAGKTLFLRSLLGEAQLVSGTVQSPRSSASEIPVDVFDVEGFNWTNESWMDNSVAYAPQQSYVRHGTIRDNITYGQPLWSKRYQEVLRQSCLLPDLSILADGDETEIGERGINLSGGQKARINLARCLYSRARTIFMDDILSAVDAHTARHIVDQALGGQLIKGRTVVLVSHHETLVLPVVDYVVSLFAGRVTEACSVGETKPINSLMDHESESVTKATVEAESMTEEDTKGKSKVPEEGIEDKVVTSRKVRTIYDDEHMNRGAVERCTYMFVLGAAGGLFYWTIFSLLYTAERGSSIAMTGWLRHWSSDPSPSHLDLNLAVYGILLTAQTMTYAITLVWQYGVGNVGFLNGASRKLHEALVDSLFSAPLMYFESIPSSRLINVFGRDMAILDNSAGSMVGMVVITTATVISSAFIVCLQAPMLVVFFAAIAPPMWYMNKFLRKLRADVRRLSATASSPVISLYHDAIDGVLMIRAFGGGQAMKSALMSLTNRERRTALAEYTVVNWVNAMVQIATSVITATAGFYLVHQEISAAQAGFVLTFALDTSNALYGLLMIFSFLEQIFVSAERIHYYVKSTPTESQGGEVPPISWPEKGYISFKDVTLRYAPELPLVLQGINIDIPAGQRVGIVGATGSGKSTLALAVLRAIELEHGSIEIDGRELAGVNVKALRKQMNIVTQDAILSSGTLREALDVTASRSDDELFEALKRVHLISQVSEGSNSDNPFINLEHPVAKGQQFLSVDDLRGLHVVDGSNFSQGQRQLLCLARSLLRSSKVLIMDEATSSVDFELDAKITETLKTAFTGVTMIVIAHRLSTIINFDQVVVLDQGRVVENGRPRDLLGNKASRFRALCLTQGISEYSKLCSAVQKGDDRADFEISTPSKADKEG